MGIRDRPVSPGSPWQNGYAESKRRKNSSQRPGEAEFVTIGIGQVEESLAPFGIARRRIWAVAGRDHSRMEGVNVGLAEDHASPPRPLTLGRLRDEIEIACSRPKARECLSLIHISEPTRLGMISYA